MSLLTLAQAVFFLVFGISRFFPFMYSDKIAAIAAIVAGILMIAKF